MNKRMEVAKFLGSPSGETADLLDAPHARQAIAGSLAALVAFLLFSFPLSIAVWLSLPLAAAIFSAVWLVVPETEDPRIVSVWRSQERVDRIRDIAAGISALEAREQVLAICERVDQILFVFRADEKWDAAPSFEERFKTMEAQIRTYARLSSRELEKASADLLPMNQVNFRMRERQLARYYVELHRSDLLDLAKLNAILDWEFEDVPIPDDDEELPELPAGEEPSGEKSIPSSTAAPQPTRIKLTPDDFGLTPREMDVLHLMAKGYKDQQIADELFKSVRTVESQVQSIRQKLSANSRTEAVLIAERAGLLSEDVPTEQSPESA